MGAPKTMLITDLDNTLWDWFAAWHASFSAMLAHLERLSGVPASVLEPEIKRVHEQRGTSEYSYLLNELPSLIKAADGAEPLNVYHEAIHTLNSVRKTTTRLYPNVRETLQALRDRGVLIVAYTESVAYWAEWRIRHTGLDGIIDVLYSAPDHDLPSGVTFENPRHRGPEAYGPKHTAHYHIASRAVKPNREVLLSILQDAGKTTDDAIYIGDSLMKDIAMAQQTGVLDVHAKYGESQHLADYGLLQRLTHWPDRTVREEQELIVGDNKIVPTWSLRRSYGELLSVFEICQGRHDSK